MFGIFEPAILVFDGSKVNLGIAFISGIITFFASCLLPLVPTYLAYLSGISLQEEHFTKKERLRIFTTGLSFVVGFIATFVILGLGLQQFSFLLNSQRELLQRFAGIMFILMGLLILGLIHPRFLTEEHKLPLQKILTNYRLIHAFLTGTAFALGWTPCIGPVLAVILYWASQSGTALQGGTLLLTFGIGVGLPFLIIAVAFENLMPLFRRYSKASYYLNIASAIIILIVGILLLIGEFQNTMATVLRFFNQHFKTY